MLQKKISSRQKKFLQKILKENLIVPHTHNPQSMRITNGIVWYQREKERESWFRFKTLHCISVYLIEKDFYFYMFLSIRTLKNLILETSVCVRKSKNKKKAISIIFFFSKYIA